MRNKNQLAYLEDFSIKKAEGTINGNIVICTQGKKDFLFEKHLKVYLEALQVQSQL